MENIKIHIITHTHWDREWYFTFEIFRGRLIRLIEKVLNLMNNNQKFKHFYLDGQMIILEDYFEIIKENEDLLNKIRDKKILVGPWYILPDEFLVMGESLIRNYLLGIQVAKKFNIPLSTVGYLPDMFGHNAYTPTILKELGLDVAVLWRGVDEKIKETEFYWESPDDNKVLVVYLRNSYSNGAHFGENIREVKERLKNEISNLSKCSTTKNILIMNGTDHEFPNSEFFEMIEELKKELNVEIENSTIEKYIDEINKENLQLKKLVGELRNPKVAHILKDITSTRIELKLLNFENQIIFLRYLEPLKAFLKMSKKSELTNTTKLWKNILKSQPHDSICGCGIDEIHMDTEVRLRNSLELGISTTAGSINDLMKGSSNNQNIELVVFNPFEHENETLISGLIKFDKNFGNIEVFDEEGNRIDSYIESIDKSINPFKNNRFQGIGGSDYLNKISFLIDFQNISNPKTVLESDYINLNFFAKLKPLSFTKFQVRSVVSKKHDNKQVLSPSFENDFFVFELNKDGSFNLFDKLNEIKYESVNYFEDIGDIGDEYNFSYIPDDVPIKSLNYQYENLIIKDFSFMKIISFDLNMKIPESFNIARKSRSFKKKNLKFSVTYKLYKKLSRIDVNVKLFNDSNDHKTMFVVNIPEKIKYVENNGYFGIINHPVDIRKFSEDFSEENVSRYAAESFVVFRGKKSKIAIVTRGIHEYETHYENNGIKASFTLLRSIEYLSRDDLSTRKGHAGPFLKTPGAQEHGIYELEYSFILLENAINKEIYKKAYQFLLKPILAISKGMSELPHFEFGESIFLTAFKIAENNKGIILRVMNVEENNEKLHIYHQKELHIYDSNMAEKIKNEIAFGKNISLEIAENTVKTFFIKIE